MKKTDEQNHLEAMAGRLQERAEVFHITSLDHLEMGRMGAVTGNPQAHLQSGIALKMSEESRKLDTALLKLLKEHPGLKIKASNDYARILDNRLAALGDVINAKVDTRGKGKASEIDSFMAALGELIGGENSSRQEEKQAECT